MVIFFLKLGPVDLLSLVYVHKYYIQNDRAKKGTGENWS